MFRSSMDRREEYPSLRPAAIRFRRQKYRTGGDRTRPRRVSAKKQHPKRCCFLLPKALPDRLWPRPLPFVPKTENSRTAESGYSINFFQAFNHEIDNQRNRKEIPKASFPFTGQKRNRRYGAGQIFHSVGCGDMAQPKPNSNRTVTGCCMATVPSATSGNGELLCFPNCKHYEDRSD